MGQDNPGKLMPMSKLLEMREEMNPDDFEVGDSPIDLTPLVEREDSYSPDDDGVLLGRALRRDMNTLKPDPEAEG